MDMRCEAASGDRCDEAPMLTHARSSVADDPPALVIVLDEGSSECHTGGSAKAAAIDAAVAPGIARNAHSSRVSVWGGFRWSNRRKEKYAIECNEPNSTTE